jgi:hypothetical protein
MFCVGGHACLQCCTGFFDPATKCENQHHGTIHMHGVIVEHYDSSLLTFV